MKYSRMDQWLQLCDELEPVYGKIIATELFPSKNWVIESWGKNKEPLSIEEGLLQRIKKAAHFALFAQQARGFKNGAISVILNLVKGDFEVESFSFKENVERIELPDNLLKLSDLVCKGETPASLAQLFMETFSTGVIDFQYEAQGNSFKKLLKVGGQDVQNSEDSLFKRLDFVLHHFAIAGHLNQIKSNHAGGTMIIPPQKISNGGFTGEMFFWEKNFTEESLEKSVFSIDVLLAEKTKDQKSRLDVGSLSALKVQ